MRRRIKIWRDPPKREYRHTIEGMLHKTLQPVEPDPDFVKRLKQNLINQKEYKEQGDGKKSKHFVLMAIGIISSLIILIYTLVRALIEIFRPKKKDDNLIDQ